ncbi:MAG: MerR family transcriptional regulator [Deinococcota bacterium]
MHPPQDMYTIQQAADRAGVTIATLRYYEQEGLLRDIQRLPNGHRRYSDQDIAWLEFLNCMRESGMPIQALKRYVSLCHQPGTGRARCDLLTDHRDVVKDKMAALQTQLERIESKIGWYEDALAEQALEANA